MNRSVSEVDAGTMLGISSVVVLLLFSVLEVSVDVEDGVVCGISGEGGVTGGGVVMSGVGGVTIVDDVGITVSIGVDVATSSGTNI